MIVAKKEKNETCTKANFYVINFVATNAQDSRVLPLEI